MDLNSWEQVSFMLFDQQVLEERKEKTRGVQQKKPSSIAALKTIVNIKISFVSTHQVKLYKMFNYHLLFKLQLLSWEETLNGTLSIQENFSYLVKSALSSQPS